MEKMSLQNLNILHYKKIMKNIFISSSFIEFKDKTLIIKAKTVFLSVKIQHFGNEEIT